MTTTYNSNFDGSKPFSDTCAQMQLGVGVEETYTVPGTSDQKYRAIFSFAENSNVYVGLNVTAASPSPASVTTTGNLEFRPREPKYVKGGDIVHAVTPDSGGAYIGISLLAITG